ncbi:MAG: LruC domain-containing protein [Alistipes finegoldii]
MWPGWIGSKPAAAYALRELPYRSGRRHCRRGEVLHRFGFGLDAGTVYFNSNTELYAAAGAIFTMDEYNAHKSGGNVRIVSQAASDQLMAVVMIREKGVSSRYYGTKFDGLMEVVYDNAADAKYVIDESSLTGGAVMRAKQTVVIPEAICNGGRQPVTPDPEPEPEYIEVKGAPYTYCFEDGWPWIGDYDMNDVVVVTGIDRLVNKESGKVGSIRINWELKAASAAHLNAFAVQLDKVAASQVASVETTNTAFGKAHSLDQVSNPATNMLSFRSLTPRRRFSAKAPTSIPQRYGARSDREAYDDRDFHPARRCGCGAESAVNAFIVVNSKSSGVFSRDTEVHMPTYKPTGFAVVSGNTFAEAEPYKYFVSKGTGMKDNYMMWALMIPGEFRYPAERKDIRTAYTYFNAWAASGGAQHVDWYEDEADEDMLY